MQNAVLFIVIAIFVTAFTLGSFIAKSLRMKEYSWKLSVIFLALALAVAVLILGTPSLGIDLRGGDILIYEVDTEKTAQVLATGADAAADSAVRGMEEEPVVNMTDLIMSLQRRINPGGVREVVIREYGENQVEIIIPEVSDEEVETIKDAIRKTGFLEFQIVVDRTRHPYLWQLGEKQLASEQELERSANVVRDGGQVVAEWVRLGREDVSTPGEVPPYRLDMDYVKSEMLWREIVPGEMEVLAVVDPENKVEGSDLAAVSRGIDDRGMPSVDFVMTGEGSVKMGTLTGSNLPDDTGREAKLGIILDNELLSAPGIRSQISSQGTIEGRFTDQEVKTLMRILRDGKMPAVLFPEPISENKISPLLGIDTIRKGSVATISSLIVVVLFMVWYYRIAGIVACFALISNLVLTIATMIMIKASFTLPGIAGLVLTVGMSVDANVLIFERIREELSRGGSLRMALRNGFDRATTTIVDANVTTLIVAVVLYVIGTADLRGFAVTLILGILMSMFTAIFCARVFFEIAERKRWLTQLNMGSFVGATHIGFLRMGPAAMMGSIVLIAVGLVGVYYRGPGLFDIDFRGGSSVQLVLKEPMPIEEMRKQVAGVAEDVWVTQINPQGREPQTVYKVDTSLENEDALQSAIQQALVDSSGNSLLLPRSLDFTPISTPEAATDGGAPEVSQRGGELLRFVSLQEKEPEPADDDPEPTPSTAEREIAPGSDVGSEVRADQAPPVPEVDESMSNLEFDPSELQVDSPAAPEGSGPEATSAAGEDEPATAALAYRSSTQLTFQEKISARTLTRLIEAAAERLGVIAPRIKLSNPNWDGRTDAGYSQWEVLLTTAPSETERILQDMRHDMEQTPVWLSSSLIGGKIAGDMRGKAIEAVLFSLVAIVGYIWLRFQSVAHGLAAVLALIHDVLVTLGLIAMSLWLAKVAGFLLVDEFKISLPIVAAFLTLIGYSLNDTIVIFDRIREVKGKSPRLTREMVDLSINQTLSRTILTSFTTLIVVAVLYAAGGDGIHGFAFALLVGVIAGTYSTVFIASPALMWMLDWWRSRGEASAREAVSVR